MNNETDLKALLARVEKATGPDRNIDADLYAMVFGEDKRHDTPFMRDLYTASIDAAHALVEKVLPRCAVRVQRNLDGKNWAELQRFGKGAEMFDVACESGNQATLPLAILAALLKAKIAEN